MYCGIRYGVGENLTVLRGEAIMPKKKSQDAFSESACWLNCQKRGFSEGSEVQLSMSGQG